MKIKRAADAADATTPCNFVTSQVANIVVRRHLWLKHWKADPLSKSSLSAEKFSGRLLFGEGALDKALVEIKERKKAMPSTSSKEKDARGKTFHSFCNYKRSRNQGFQEPLFLQLLSKNPAQTL